MRLQSYDFFRQYQQKKIEKCSYSMLPHIEKCIFRREVAYALGKFYYIFAYVLGNYQYLCSE